MILFHGSCENFSELKNEVVFFSSNEGFASDYGTVKPFRINATRIFDTCNEQHVNELLCQVGFLHDAYDEIDYNNWSEYEAHSNFGSDSWEIFEPHFKEIKRLGYDTVLIYEGGYENYSTLKGNFEAIEIAA